MPESDTGGTKNGGLGFAIAQRKGQKWCKISRSHWHKISVWSRLRRVLEDLPLAENSNYFVFDNQMLAQCVYAGFRTGEVSCPTKYFAEASSMSFGQGVKYGLGVLQTSMQFFLQKHGLAKYLIFDANGRRLSDSSASAVLDRRWAREARA